MTLHHPRRCSHAHMIEHPSTTDIILVDTGNYPAVDKFLNESWSFNGTTTDWTLLSATALTDPDGPLPGRIDYAYSVAPNNNIVLFGGRDSTIRKDTWLFNGTAWSSVTPATSPTARFGACSTYVNGYGTYLFGGANTKSLYRDLWLWNGITWASVVPTCYPAVGPVARCDAAVCNPPAATYMFGGRGSESELQDFWVYIPFLNISIRITTATHPSARYGHNMVYDATNNEIVLFGGVSGGKFNNETWTYTVPGGWVLKTPAHKPSCRGYAQMAYSSVAGSVILYGGLVNDKALNDTWSWTGTDWIEL